MRPSCEAIRGKEFLYSWFNFPFSIKIESTADRPDYHAQNFILPKTFRYYPQQLPGFTSSLVPAGVDRNFCLQRSLQK
jgi:hypothetical protein